MYKLQLPGLPDIEIDCDAAVPSIYPLADGTYGCRCIVCAYCGKHTGNSHQGHCWAMCKVTKKIEEFHFCCDDRCELEDKKTAE